jgi:hypothetical protein
MRWPRPAVWHRRPSIHPFHQSACTSVRDRSLSFVGHLKIYLYNLREREREREKERALFTLSFSVQGPCEMGSSRNCKSMDPLEGCYRVVNNVHLKWVRCNKRNGAKKGGDNRVRSKAGRRVRKNFAFPTPGGSGSRQSAPDATSFPEPSPPDGQEIIQILNFKKQKMSERRKFDSKKEIEPARRWASRRRCNIL